MITEPIDLSCDYSDHGWRLRRRSLDFERSGTISRSYGGDNGFDPTAPPDCAPLTRNARIVVRICRPVRDAGSAGPTVLRRRPFKDHWKVDDDTFGAVGLTNPIGQLLRGPRHCG